MTALQADVMFPSIAPGPRRALSQDDRDGITFLLPAASPPPLRTPSGAIRSLRTFLLF